MVAARPFPDPVLFLPSPGPNGPSMSDHASPPPLFILAPPSLPGQTLAAALGQSPAAYDLPELNLEQMEGTDQLQRELIGIRGMQMLGLLRAVAQLYGGEQTGIAVEMARRWLNARAHLPTAQVARELAAKIAPRRMVTPVTAALFDGRTLGRLSAIFPDATWVHLVAHPVTYGEMLLARPEGEATLMITGSVDEEVEPPVPDPQLLWQEVEGVLAPFLDGLSPDRVIRVDAVRLAQEPQAVLAEVAGAAGLPTDPQALAAMAHPERSIFAGPGPLGAPLPGQIEPLKALAARFAPPDAAPGAPPRVATLVGPLPWRDDGTGLNAGVRARAEALGYG